MLEYPTYLDDETPTECAECSEPLPEDNATGFCCKDHEQRYVARQRAADDAYAQALADEAMLAAEWKAEQQRERALPKATEVFEVPARLLPSTGVGLAMTTHFMQTPVRERV